MADELIRVVLEAAASGTLVKKLMVNDEAHLNSFHPSCQWDCLRVWRGNLRPSPEEGRTDPLGYFSPGSFLAAEYQLLRVIPNRNCIMWLRARFPQAPRSWDGNIVPWPSR